MRDQVRALSDRASSAGRRRLDGLTAKTPTRPLLAVWAERALAAVWRSATTLHLRTEACLEAALAAALEEPEVLRRLAERMKWTLPEGVPVISTQDTVGDGRTDITLTWPKGGEDGGAYRLVLELKVDAPPDWSQVERYLREGTDVVAVARYARHYDVPTGGGGKFLGVVRWRQILEIWWNGAPLPLRQLHHLLDATRVAMPNITLPNLTGLVASWSAWDVLRDWSREAAEGVAADFNKAGHTWVMRESKKGKRAFDETNERYVARLWPAPLRLDWLYLHVGLFMGREGEPVLVDGVPDLFFALHLDPGKPMGKRLQEDEGLKAAVKRWTGRSDKVRREHLPESWEVLRARVSALELLQGEDQPGAFVAWMRARAQEWEKDGILGIVAQLEAETRKETGEAKSEE